MTPEFWVQIAVLVCTLFLSFAAAIWTGAIYFSKQFREIRDLNSAEFTALKLELNTVSTTVAPYSHEISKLQAQQQQNSLDIAEIKGWGDRLASLERQMENVPRR